MRFYECKHCGNIITYHREVTPKVQCCGRAMLEMEPNTTDAANEKHVPVLDIQGRDVLVTVGKVEHPMTEEHHIQWVLLETSRGYHKHYLQPEIAPDARFTLQKDEVVKSAYEFCNLHGLWKTRRRDE